MRRQLLVPLMVVVAWMTVSVSGRKKIRIALNKLDVLSAVLQNQTQQLKDIQDQINEKCQARDNTEPTPPPQGLASMVRDGDGYYLAFRATAHIGKNSSHSYLAVGQNDDDISAILMDDVPCGCKGVDGREPCDRHYRSVLLDLWPRLSVEKVRVALYTNGVEQLRMTFDGQGTDYLNFFTQDRLLDSPYTDLASATPFIFSVEGHPDSNDIERRFFIHKNYYGCSTDEGWLVVLDANASLTDPSGCAWEKQGGSAFPKFFYSTANTASIWESEHMGQADVFTVSIKLKDKSTCLDNVPK